MARVRVSVAATFDPDTAASIDFLRRLFGSKAWSRIPPHITLVPPFELEPDAVWPYLSRVARATALITPFEIALGEVAEFANRRRVGYLSVRDDGSLEAIASALASQKRKFIPHVTVVEGIDARKADALKLATGGAKQIVRIDEVSVLLADLRDPARKWRPLVAVRLGESFARTVSHFRLQLIPVNGGLLCLRDEAPVRSVLAIDESDGHLAGAVVALMKGEFAILHDIRVFNPEDRGYGIGRLMTEAIVDELAPKVPLISGKSSMARLFPRNVDPWVTKALGLAGSFKTR